MAFPDSYQVVGNKRQKVRQYGNAVTPPVMRLLTGRVADVLA
jgi:DNA (cytosine-5)-methyltransferase 1